MLNRFYATARRSILNNPNSRRWPALILLAVTVSVPFVFLHGRLSITLTPSVGYRLFFISWGTEAGSLGQGDYVLFPVKGFSAPFIKKITCADGSVLAMQDDGYFCNGEYLGRAIKKKAQPFVWNGAIPKDKLFVMGSHADSYDSRYFGFIDRKEVTARVVPIF